MGGADTTRESVTETTFDALRITIVVSSGASMAHVRNVVDLFANTAAQTLRNQGLVPVDELREVPIGDASVG